MTALDKVSRINGVLGGAVLHDLYAHAFVVIQDGVQFSVRGSQKVDRVQIRFCEKRVRYQLSFWRRDPKRETFFEVASYLDTQEHDVIGTVFREVGLPFHTSYFIAIQQERQGT